MKNIGLAVPDPEDEEPEDEIIELDRGTDFTPHGATSTESVDSVLVEFTDTDLQRGMS